ncbi:MAG TPA: Nif3-like dinuclear metal center hexameric protein, partial [Candidatus Babeliaceae bacterium]|nr:Nif3-like dinuclear metal center hexameric protein [Candidatus Babeliaceae bacterium]
MDKKSFTCQDLSNFLNNILDPLRIDEPAPNGLQIENIGPISRAATAVTASLETIEKAIALKAQALIVHHGIFKKGEPYPITGAMFKKVKALINNNIALLGYHLPLDAHQELGNNWKAARDLGLSDLMPFGEYGKISIGVRGFLEPIPF